MYRKYLMLLLSLLFICRLNGQEISVTYDYTSVEKVIEIFEKGRLDENDFKEIIELHGTQAYLRKLSNFFPGVDELKYRKSLEAALKGTYKDNDPYMFERLVPLIPDAKNLLKRVVLKENDLTKSAVLKLNEYSPKTIQMNATVYLVLGVIGGGWTFDDSPSSFYVDFSSMKGDYEGLSYLSTHELYHLVQYRFMKGITKNTDDKVSYLLDQMIREGSATYIVDFSKASSSGAYINFSKKEYENNFRRMEINFALFENILFQAKYDPMVNIDFLYDIGYSGLCQSPLYYVGYHMMKLIEKYNGKQALVSLLSQPPYKMILSYSELCDKYGSDDEDIILLSESILDIFKQ